MLGVEDSQTVRMPVGKKEVFITFRVEASDYFRRDGSDIHTDAAISISQAILGGATRIQGIYENLTVEVPELINVFSTQVVAIMLLFYSYYIVCLNIRYQRGRHHTREYE